MKIIYPDVHRDNRGYFFESYQQQKYFHAGIESKFTQDNVSMSSYGTIRGIHFQIGDKAQAKLVQVSVGRVLDIVVDIDPSSSTYGKHVSMELDDENHKQIFIPRGYGHGFSVLSKIAVFQYRCDNFYHPSSEAGFRYNDPYLNIDWKIPESDQIVSDKDRRLPLFKK